MTRRRSRLMLLALALLVGDLLFLGWRWQHDTGANATITYAGLDWTRMVVGLDRPVARLQAGRWYLNASPLPDITAYAKRQAARGLMPVVSAPTYGQLIPILRDLKARGACNIMIREGGTLLRNIPPPEEAGPDSLDIPAFVLCGEATGDTGFYGALPADGPIHVSPAASLR